MSTSFKIKKIIAALMSIVFVFSMFACAQYNKPITKYKSKARPQIKEEKEIVTPEIKRPQEFATPKLRASMELVEEGKRYLRANEYSKASQSFQEAIGIDSGNGEAYFYMALADYNLGNLQSALGFLEKAETLLSEDEWTEKINTLRDKIYAGIGN